MGRPLRLRAGESGTVFALGGARDEPRTGATMRWLDEDRQWEMVALMSAALGGIGARMLMTGGWKLARGGEPPENPAARSVHWGEAIAWTVVTGMVVGVMRLLAERGAASGWRRVRGHYPKGLE